MFSGENPQRRYCSVATSTANASWYMPPDVALKQQPISASYTPQHFLHLISLEEQTAIRWVLLTGIRGGPLPSKLPPFLVYCIPFTLPSPRFVLSLQSKPSLFNRSLESSSSSLTPLLAQVAQLQTFSQQPLFQPILNHQPLSIRYRS